MSRNLVIPYYRPTFVEKTISEVGHGTFFPLLVTLDQIAEIFFRVKDAWISSGSVTFTEALPSDGINDFTMTVPAWVLSDKRVCHLLPLEVWFAAIRQRG
jgi:hypothetical protein